MPNVTTVRGAPTYEHGDFVPASFREKDGDKFVDLMASTGVAVLRVPWWEDPYEEELEVAEPACRLDRMNAGAPLLESHWKDLRSQIGVVTRAWIDDGRLMCTIKFSRRQEVAGIVEDVRAGVIRNASIGYQVLRYLDVTPKDAPRDSYRRLRAVDWRPFEVSLVTVPAEAGAGTRGIYHVPNTEAAVRAAPQLHEIEIEAMPMPPNPTGTRNQDTPATPTVPADGTRETPATPAGAQPVQPAPAAQPARAQSDGVEAERTRSADLLQVLRQGGLRGDELINEHARHVREGTQPDVVRRAMLERLSRADSATSVAPQFQVGATDADHLARGIEEALVHRSISDTSKRPKLTEAGARCRNWGLRRMAEEFMLSRGVANARDLSPDDLYTRICAMSVAARAHDATADFPAILANVAQKSGMIAYESTPRTFTMFGRRDDAFDFKQRKFVQLSGGTALGVVPESGEVPYMHFTDAAEHGQLATYGRQFALTRQAFYNDDLGMFSRWTRTVMSRCADKESDVVWNLFVTGGVGVTMNDGVALFNQANHGNYSQAGSGATLSNDGINVPIAKMMKLVDKQGNMISVRPRWLIGVPDQWAKIRQILTATVPANSAGVNPWAGELQPLIEPRLATLSGGSTAAFYVAADNLDGLIFGYLQGQDGPKITTAVELGVDGMKWQCLHDFFATIVESAAFQKSDGVA